MKNKIISGIFTALMCISLIDVPYVFRSIDASAEVTANEDETLASYAKRVWEIVNEERAKEGIAPMNFSPQLSYAANIRASEIIRNGDHTRPDGSKWNTVFDENRISAGSGGENILSMTNMFPVAEVAMSAWMGSQIHHDNIMNSNFTNIGVGVAQEGNSYYIVQIFANEAVSWDVSDGNFILDGIGGTPSYNPDNRPWNEYLENITSTSVGSHITEIGRYLFSGMNNLQSVTLPESVKKIDIYAFNDCSSLGELIFMNPECEIEGSNETIPSGTVICGYENSTAQTFAETYGYNFRVLENSLVTLGDVNADGFIDALDATDVLIEYASLSTAGISTFTDEQKISADVNSDGVVDSVDGSYILAYYAYLSTGDDAKLNMSEWLKNNPL
ncbi:MAG: leucine-rich repeat protein [Ruminococcus sp.]|nr:leucine-rich repeat protein [Ruminococcus sp.]